MIDLEGCGAIFVVFLHAFSGCGLNEKGMEQELQGMLVGIGIVFDVKIVEQVHFMFCQELVYEKLPVG